ncbi:RNA recognition motif-containing protein RRM [Reticulomyxa filosa]|uniref:RNA recognition motif-containing protein RRM n=1 Tax=Reticulomyxa filosa TaxID=46433 RepID=X6LY04_RETFI|nr:RNA recognition motif-containing protein RRM [Reticulomyxa filosa]|eukprot:ETO06484.1 RNA recognition motif-containing protein RRM [Reticulomyxa filosa]
MLLNYISIGKVKCNGGMQDNNYNDTNEKGKYIKEIKILIRLFGDSMNKEELKQKIMNNNGNIELVIKELVQLSVENEVYYNNNNNISCFIITEQEQEQTQENTMVIFNNNNNNNNNIQREIRIGETKPGINLQGDWMWKYCIKKQKIRFLMKSLHF